MNAVRGKEVQLGRSVMETMHVPKQRPMIHAVYPIAKKARRNPIDQKRERDFEDSVGRQRDPCPVQLFGGGICQSIPADRDAKREYDLEQSDNASELQQIIDEIDLCRGAAPNEQPIRGRLVPV